MPTTDTPQVTAFVGSLRELLGNVYGMYFRVKSAHWNVEGPFFGPLHAYFDDVADDVFSSADTIAEAMRFHRYYTPTSIETLAKLNTVSSDEFKTGDPKPLLEDILNANMTVLASLQTALRLAKEVEDIGVENFLQERVFAHEKHAWQVRSHLKSFVEPSA